MEPNLEIIIEYHSLLILLHKASRMYQGTNEFFETQLNTALDKCNLTDSKIKIIKILRNAGLLKSLGSRKFELFYDPSTKPSKKPPNSTHKPQSIKVLTNPQENKCIISTGEFKPIEIKTDKNDNNSSESRDISSEVPHTVTELKIKKRALRNPKVPQKVPLKNTKVPLLTNNFTKLTKREEQILKFLTENKLNVNQIAKKLNCDISVVYKHIKHLREKGLLNQKNEAVITRGGTTGGVSMSMREKEPSATSKCHFLPEIENGEKSTGKIIAASQQYVIRILEKLDGSYDKLRINLTDRIEGNYIKCNRNSIEVHNSTKRFRGETRYDASLASFPWLYTFITKLEYAYKVKLIQEGSQNIRQVKAHFSDIDNPLSHYAERRKFIIQAKAKDDGKIWLWWDNSFEEHHLETGHPETGGEDMSNIVESFFNQERDNPGTFKNLFELANKEQKEKHAIEISSTHTSLDRFERATQEFRLKHNL